MTSPVKTGEIIQHIKVDLNLSFQKYIFVHKM